jgi:phage shock protein PspC (stress-responsive transcriptional regulator)
MKKLYKSKENIIFLGVLGGVAEYLDADPTAIRLLFLFLVFITGFVPGILFYILAAIVMPDKEGKHRKTVENEVKE